LTRLIVRAASREAARAAHAAGADGVEAASPEAVAPIAEAIGGRCPLGAAIPPMPTVAALIDAARQALAQGADYVILPVSDGAETAATCRRIAAELPPGSVHAAIGTGEADPTDWLGACAAAGFAGARLDLSRGRSPERLPVATIGRFVRACAAAGLAAGLCGPFEAPDVPRLLELEPDALILALPDGGPSSPEKGILDAIRLLTASGHWIVIESLAERIAAQLLRHPRAMRVSVRIEKLDVCPCVVGVEIVRVRGEQPAHG